MHGNKAEGRIALTFLLRLCVVLLALLSAMFMASSACLSGSGAATFTYTRFGAFVFFIICGFTAFILEGAALYLLSILVLAAKAQGGYEMGTEQATRNGKARIALAVVDLLVTVLLASAMVAAFTAGVVYRDEIGACASFAGQVKVAKIVSAAAAFVAGMLANLTPVLARLN